MQNYLGEFDVEIENSPFKDYNKFDWAMYFIESYGQIDREHHKAWVLDQVARIYNDSKPIIKLAKWHDGKTEYRIFITEPTENYYNWVSEMKSGKEGAEIYSYDEGTAP